MSKDSTKLAEKKRKRDSVGKQHSTKKRSIDRTAHTSPSIKVVHVPSDATNRPVIATTPGLTIPHDLQFNAYAHTESKELLLHSGQHDRLDFIAREDTNQAVKHYVGFHDEETNEIQLVEARYVQMRSSLRSEEKQVQLQREQALDRAQARKLDRKTARQDLGMEFGTKKAKQAINALKDNQIGPDKPRTPKDAERVKAAVKQNSSAAAILESMADVVQDDSEKVEIQQMITDSKARPKHNPSVTSQDDIEDVYPLSEIIGEEVLKNVKVKPWYDATEGGVEIETESKFVSRRVKSVCKMRNTKGQEKLSIQRAKVLKYLLYLLKFIYSLKPAPGGGKKLPLREELNKITDGDTSIMDCIKNKFTSGSTMTRWQLDYLYTHICVLTLAADGFITDILDIREDLGLQPATMNKYFREIGANLKPMPENVRLNWVEPNGEKRVMLKTESALHKFAELKVPLDFPRDKKLVMRRK